MTIQEITSFSDPETIYSLTINKDGYAIDCTCNNHYFAKKRGEISHVCKHMKFHNGQVEAAKREREAARRHAPLNGNRGFSLW